MRLLLQRESMDEEALFRLVVEPFVAQTAAQMARQERVAHYTTAANLLSILSGGEFWLSNVMAMNDIAEIRAAGTAIEQRYQEQIGAFSTSQRPFLDELMSSFGRLHRDALSNTYAMSFSAHNPGDRDGRLSMWRAYAGDGDGVCLVIRRRNLMRDAAVDFPVASIAMRYETEGQFLSRVAELLAHAQSVFDQHHDFCISLGSRLADLLGYALTLMAISHKHVGFSEEQEFRLFHIAEHMPISLAGIRYDAVPVGRIAKPVLRVAVKNYPEVGLADATLTDLLEEVIVGPSVHAELQCEAIRLALNLRGLNEVAVRTSSIPYRAPR